MGKENKDYGGDLYKEHYFEQYKLYLNSIEHISDRRSRANQYFITINSGILVLIGLVVKHESGYKGLLLSGLCVFGVIVSIIFYYLINAYKQLNTGKFKILQQIENNLPIELYKQEWEALGKGENKKLYFPFSHIEKIIPIVFGVSYFLLLIGIIIYFIIVPSAIIAFLCF
jgi:hypothetical protein